MMPVRWLTSRSRTRWRACKSSCSTVFVATNFMVGRCTASAIGSASWKSFFCPFEYPTAKASGDLAIADPEINSDTGYPILNMRFPVYHDGDFIGCVGASLTLDVLTRFLASHRASPHSLTIIADQTDGKIIAASDKQKSVRLSDGKLEVARLESFADEDVREAYRLKKETIQHDFLFRSPRDGQELSASFARFPEGFARPWEAVAITPIDDFVGQLKATNQQILLIIIALSIAELFLIYLLSRRLSQPIENISQELKTVESLSFEQPAHRPSKVHR